MGSAAAQKDAANKKQIADGFVHDESQMAKDASQAQQTLASAKQALDAANAALAHAKSEAAATKKAADGAAAKQKSAEDNKGTMAKEVVEANSAKAAAEGKSQCAQSSTAKEQV